MSSATPLILASASPRRRELLSYLGVAFTVLPATIDETIPDRVEDSTEFARSLAEEKSREVAGRHPTAAVLAADTIVVLEGEILGKPADGAEARETLQRLRNRPHEVITALALAYQGDVWRNHATTSVFMRDYSDDEIDAYIASGDPFDKAGSYAIQDREFRPVERCEGCYCNVVGLPLIATLRMLQQLDFTMLDMHGPDLPPQCHRCPLADLSERVDSLRSLP